MHVIKYAALNSFYIRFALRSHDPINFAMYSKVILLQYSVWRSDFVTIFCLFLLFLAFQFETLESDVKVIAL